ncbi:unnamed protein product [Strongylus vulgaris]|uniref:Uncharacterized protein n=1 Tax=Strongylus vulgaris TaxID=40348 RepID=A0A3P7K0X9_STRVU|nr:unnamed protein product [Strongylus vulgaris]
MNCGESPDHWQYLVEVLEVPGSRGEANLVEKCKLCNRVNTVIAASLLYPKDPIGILEAVKLLSGIPFSLAIIPDSIGSYDAEEHNEEWQSMLQFDCRGLEPFDFEPRNGWTAVGIESGTVFDDIDLSEKVICAFISCTFFLCLV